MKREALEQLETRLRAEAGDIREKNGFSPLLHQRVMATLRQKGLTPAPVRPEARSPWRFIGPVAAAAAVALAAWLVLRRAPVDPAPRVVKNQIPDMPQVPISHPVDPTTSALESRKYAYLDRDARKLLTFVADQLPAFPNPPK